MYSLITLHLLPGEDTMEFVKQLPGLRDLSIDLEYGLIPISPKRRLFTIRVLGDMDADKLQEEEPRVRGIHGDVKISPI